MLSCDSRAVRVSICGGVRPLQAPLPVLACCRVVAGASCSSRAYSASTVVECGSASTGRDTDTDVTEVVGQQLLHQARDTPAIQHGVVKGEHQVDPVVSRHVRPHAVQRHLVDRVGPNSALCRICALLGVGPSSHHVERRRWTAVHDLDRHRMARQLERRAQGRMARHQAVECLDELRFLPGHLQAVGEDVAVGRRVGSLHAVKEHSQLQCSRRERTPRAAQPHGRSVAVARMA